MAWLSSFLSTSAPTKATSPLITFSFVLSCHRLRFLLTSIQDILKRFRFDLPAGIEHDYANWEKVTTAVSYSLTQIRSRLKKLVSCLDITVPPHTYVYPID
jgi:hypothetical protein